MGGEHGGRQGKRPTLEDVAAAAGVSRALVSIVMRDVPGASAATRSRVLQTAQELGYRPDAFARLLAERRPRLIGVVFGMTGSFHFDLLEGLYASAEDRGYQLVLSALTPHRNSRLAVESLLDFRCDALILLGPDRRTPVPARPVPTVVVGWKPDDPTVGVVRTSDIKGMRLAFDHLVAMGHSRIVHIDGGPGGVSVARRQAYRQEMRRRGLGDAIRVLPGTFSQDAGYAAATELLRVGELPTAVVAYNDHVATGLLESLLRAGVDVPGDVSIVGWDDSDIARLPHVMLTSVRQDAAAMAHLAIERCHALLTVGEQVPGDRVLDPTLVLRETTGPIAGILS